MMHRWFLALALLVSSPVVGWAADWPHRNGPYRNNTTPEIVPAWKEPLQRAFHVSLGEGYSSPTVADGRLFLHHKLKDQDVEEVLALDAETGNVLWRFSYPHKPFESNVGNGPRGAPCIALGKVYAYGITGILTCLKADTGEKLWQINALENFHAPIMMFGASAGPLVEGNRLYLPVGNAGSSLVALDANTGEVIWKSLDDPPTSVTPVTFAPRIEGQGTMRQLIYVSTRGLFGVQPSDGKPLWDFPLTDLLPIGTIPPPTVAGDTVITSSMLTGTIAFRIAETSGALKPVETWRNPAVTCYFTQSVTVGDQLYILNATLIPAAEIALSCLDLKTGKELWKQPKVGIYQLNMIRTGDNKLLMLDDVRGDAILLDANPHEYRELARSKVCKPTIINPAIAGGRLYFRDDEGASCYALPK